MKHQTTATFETYFYYTARVNLEQEEFWELTLTQDNWENFRISGCLLALTQQAIPAPEPRLGPSGLLVENEFEVSSLESAFNIITAEIS